MNKPYPYSPYMIVAQGNPHSKTGIKWKIQIPGSGRLVGGWKSYATAEKNALILSGGAA
jgi:hypothetical protein